MAAAEFQLIDRYLTRLGAQRGDVVLGPGDDAALIASAGRPLAVAHAGSAAGGDPQADAASVFHRACSTLHAAGASPAWATLAVSLGENDEDWLRAFAGALDGLCRDAGVSVVGGDTTAGARAVTLFVTGTLATEMAPGMPPGDA